MYPLMFILLGLVWGSNFILMKWVYVVIGPIGVAASRVTGGAIVLWLIWLMSDKATRGCIRKLTAGDWLAILIPVIIGSAYPYFMQPYLIGKHQNSAFFGMMVGLIPLLTVLVSIPLLRALPTLRELGGVLLGLGCMLILFHDGEMRGMPVHDLVLAGLVPTCYAFSNTFIKRRLSQIPSLLMTAIILGLAGLLLTPLSVVMEGVKHVNTATFLRAFGMLAWLSIVGTGLATAVFYRMIQVKGPLYAGMVAYVIPLGAVVWGWVDQETVTARQLFSLAGIIVAVVLVQYKKSRKPND